MKRFFTLILVLGLLFTIHASAQWQEVNNGLYGASIYSIAVSGNDIFVGTNGSGVFLSTGLGESWVQKNNGLTDYIVNAIAIKGSTIVAGTTSGIFISMDYGNTWEQRNNGLTMPDVRALAFMGDTIFAGSRDYDGMYNPSNSGSLYSSIDGGNTWIEKNNGLNKLKVFSIFVRGKDLFVGTLHGLYHSTDKGESWEVTGFSTNAVTDIDFAGNVIFIATDSGLFYSSDMGVTWGIKEHVGSDCLVINGNTIIAGANYGVWTSTDSGDNWVSTQISDVIVQSLATCNNKIIAGTNQGLYISQDIGATWAKKVKGITNASIPAIIKDKNTLYAATKYDGVYSSTNNGDNWVQKNTGFSDFKLLSFSANGNDLYAGTYGGGVFYSSDNGDSWAQRNNGFDGLIIPSIITLDNNVFAGGKGGVYLSTDKGYNWILQKIKPQGGEYDPLALTKDTIYVGHDGNVYKTTNKGETWIGADFFGINTYSIAVDSNYVVVGTENGIYISSDYGATWKLIAFKNIYMCSIAFIDNKIIVGNDEGVSFSQDFGKNWYRRNQGLTNSRIMTLSIIGNELFAGADGGGVYKCDLNYFQNQMPTISSISDLTTELNTPVEANFTVTDEDPNSIILTAVSNNQVLIHSSDCTFSGPGNDRTIKITPQKDKYGVSTITLTVSDGEYQSTEQFKVTVKKGQGIDESNQESFLLNITPNPAYNNIRISIANDLQNVNLKITNTKGTVVYQNNTSYFSKNNPMEIETKAFPAGVYFCTITDGIVSETIKFVVAK